MFLQNLGILELLGLFSAASALVVALYLFDRSRRKLVVSSLRFWIAAQQPPEKRHRRRIQQPWSLLLQLLGILLLLLAAAQLKWGSRESSLRDHVLLLDTSAWMGARTGQGTLMDEARKSALAYVRSLPAADRVMLVRADAFPAPVTGMEANHSVVESAIRSSQPGSAALDLPQAMAFAQRIQGLGAQGEGEIVYAGAGRARQPGAASEVRNLRVLPVDEALENCGLREIGLRRAPNDANLWEIFVAVRNYGRRPRTVTLALQFGNAPAGSRRLTLAPGTEQNATFAYRTHAAGWLEARLLTQDAFPQDDRALLELPSQTPLRVAVYSREPDRIRPVLNANPRVAASYLAPSAWREKPDADVVIIDGFRPPKPPELPAIWIDPPADGSPVRVRSRVENQQLSRWRSEHTLGSGLHTEDLKLDSASVFEAGPADILIAEVDKGPVILARPGAHKLVVMGFDPLRSTMRYELATPLLFANILRWISPEVFRRWELAAGSTGTQTVTLDAETAAADIKVLDEKQQPLPFALHGRTVRFFSGTPGTVRVVTPEDEVVRSLTLPDVPETRWQAPKSARRGVPKTWPAGAYSRDLWRFLALLGGLVLFAEWWIYGRARTLAFTRRWPLALKALSLLAILVALFEPAMRIAETKMAVGLLVDTSASVPAADLAREASLSAALQSAKGRHALRIIPFARSIRELDGGESVQPMKFVQTAGEAGRGTDLEAALREGLAALPAGLVPRLVLISDGRENHGSVTRAAWQARQLGIPIDTYALPGRPQPRLALDSATVPAVAFTGERFPIDLVMHSPQATTAAIELTAEGKQLGSSSVALVEGENRFRVHAALGMPGAFDLSGRISAPELGEVRFSQAVSLRRPKVLFVSEDPAGTEKHLLQMLDAARFEVERGSAITRANLSDYQIVVLNNWDLEAIPAARKTQLQEYVKQGGGLLVIGGENNRYVEKKKGVEDDLEKALPAKLAPPRSPEGTCVVLIVDKSSSMEGKKVELARLAAIGVIDNLRPIDSVGVLIFDNSFQWAVPIRKAEDKSLIKRLVSGITPDGGTQIAPALSEAYRRILPNKATFKHIVLLTDGISEEGDSVTLSREAALQNVTISTVGLGQDVNRAFLERVALNARGKAYFLTDPAGLEQILLKDVKEHTGSTAIEKPFQPEVLRKAEILEGVAIETAPALKGYVKFTAKPTAETILQVDKKDPLLSRWQYGLGRAVVFASDAKSRWAEAWVSWPGFDRLWANIFRDLLPHAQAGETAVDYDRAKGELIIEYRLAPQVEEPAAIPGIFAIGPDGFQSPVDVKKIAAGAYRGSVAIGGRTGLFRIRPLSESQVFPEVGYYRPEEELLEHGSDEFLLREVAAFTGGHFQPAAAQVFDAGRRSIPAMLRLWPGLLGLAILLSLAELILRKWPGLMRRD